MPVMYEVPVQNGICLVKYDSDNFYLTIKDALTNDGADEDRVIDVLIDAFKNGAELAIFKPAEFLIEADKAPWFGLAILSVLSAVPEVLGAATRGYVFKGDDGKAEKRHNLGMNNYILWGSGFSDDDRKHWSRHHWENVRCGLAHSIVAANTWTERPGLEHRVLQEGLAASIDVLIWHKWFKSGFDLYISKVLNRNNRDLRCNFMKYVTQQE